MKQELVSFFVFQTSTPPPAPSPTARPACIKNKTKLQSVVRGWLARRLARVLLLRGGCRREVDEGSGAWQYVWAYRSHPSAAFIGAGAARASGTRGRGRGSAAVAEGEAFRSWYPPALLKNESLPSPRAAQRRVEAEERKREARLALAKSLSGDQSGECCVARGVRWAFLWTLAGIKSIKSMENIEIKGAQPPGRRTLRRSPLENPYVTAN